MDAIGNHDPLREAVGVALHLQLERLLHRRRAVDVGEGVGELFVVGEELLLRQIEGAEPIFRLMMLHFQQRHHELCRIGFGQPSHILVKRVLDLVAGVAQLLAQAFGFGIAEDALLRGHLVEIGFEDAELFAQRLDVVGAHVAA